MIEDYRIYKFHAREYVVLLLLCFGICIGTALLFYKNLYISILLSPVSILIYRRYKRFKIRKRAEQLNMQFKDALVILAAGLEAGYSMENALQNALSDIRMLYEEKSYIIVELKRINALIANNTPTEEAIQQFAERSWNEDIKSFSQVYRTARLSGGNLVAIMHGTTRTIVKKYEITKEIQTAITAKKMEVTIMKVMPFIMILYLNLCSPNFLKPLYGNIFGICFMTVMLLVIFFLCLLADKIMDIEV